MLFVTDLVVDYLSANGLSGCYTVRNGVVVGEIGTVWDAVRVEGYVDV